MPGSLAGASLGDHTTIHPIGVSILIVLVIAILKLPRERAIIPILLIITVVPSAQRIVIGSLDFSFIRILVMFGLARIYFRGEGRGLKLEKSDSLLRYWMVWGILSYGLLLESFSGIITRTGFMIDVVGAYYIGRVYIRTSDDIRRVTLMLGLIAIPMMVIFLIERVTGKNAFFIFGGVPENSLVRNGRLRCQGPFSHPIMAGVFWAGVLPWLCALWFGGMKKLKIAFFIGCIVFIVGNTASSTPVMAILFSILGIAMFGIRQKMPLIRKCLLILLLTLHMIMDAPIWHLISRIDLSGGSTGWHRYNLIQQAINHIEEWWMFGITSTGHWGRGLQDITNQYLLEGVRGGLLGMILFVLFISSVFTLVGKRMKRTTDKAEMWILWASGVTLFVHAMSFLAVSYFGQMGIAFYLFVGAIVSVASNKVRAA